MENLSRKRAALLITFLVITWGGNWPLAKFALAYTPPVLFAGIRTLLGGLILLIFAIPRLKQLNLKQAWPIYLISSLLNIILFYGLQTVGLNYMPAGLFSMIVFLQPVLMGIFSWLWLGESMNAAKIIGLVLGFSGVAMISASSLSEHISTAGVLLALATSVSWALGTVYVKKVGDRVDSIWLVTLQLLFGGVFMTALGSGFESWSSIQWSPAFIISLLFISIFVIAIGWLVFFILIGAGEASKVASYTFLIPLIAVMSSTLLLHEPFTFYLLIGIVFIITSIYLVNRKPKQLVAKCG